MCVLAKSPRGQDRVITGVVGVDGMLDVVVGYVMPGIGDNHTAMKNTMMIIITVSILPVIYSAILW